MGYRCPLCLKELKDSDQLVRHCTKCQSGVENNTEQFNCTSENLPSKIFCAEAGCEGNDLVGTSEGVFLYHTDCEAKNPFWVSDSLINPQHQVADDPAHTIPPDDDTLENFFSRSSNSRAQQKPAPLATQDKTQGHVVIPGGDLQEPNAEACCTLPGSTQPIPFTHWEVLMLRVLPPSEKMWFPAMLLRATAEEHQGKRIGALIGMVGEQAVGKTILTVQAIDVKGYVPPDQRLKRAIEVRDYIYSRPRDEATDVSADFLATLCLRSHMRDNTRGFFLPEGTPSSVGDLKVALIKPAAVVDTTRDQSLFVVRERWRKFRNWSDNLASTIEQRIKENTQMTPGYRPLTPELQGTASKGRGITNTSPFWYTVSFYDTRGEHSRSGSKPLMDVINAVDKVAILVDARDLFGEKDGSSLVTAKNNIKFYKDSKKSKCCLVVTQVDNLHSKRMKGSLREAALRVSTDSDGREAFGKSNTQLLIMLLEESIAKGLSKENREELVNLLRGSIDTFFVWTEGLPRDGQPISSEPISYGLAQFVCWCLGVTLPDIIQTAN